MVHFKSRTPLCSRSLKKIEPAPMPGFPGHVGVDAAQ
jgi:hypothetical protein